MDPVGEHGLGRGLAVGLRRGKSCETVNADWRGDAGHRGSGDARGRAPS